MTIDVHELVNMPGAGKAEKALRKAGMWDETKACDGIKEFEFKVKVTGYYDPQLEEQVVTVTAKSKDEAEDLAWEEVDFDDCQDCEILEVNECN